MLTSSPTISAPPSPSAAFHHAHSHSHSHSHSHAHARSYHASRRTSSSASAPSPRFPPQVNGAPSRRLDAPHHSTSTSTSASSTAHSPAATFARSPLVRRREYADAATQYTPPLYPPTYRPPQLPQPTQSAPVALPDTATTTRTLQGESSAHASDTEPPEPGLRVDPQPAPQVVPPPVTRPARRSSKEIAGQHDQQQQQQQQQEAKPDEAELPSPSKRVRSQDASVKVMPLKYETCDVNDLGVLISDMLMELVRLNDGFPLRDGQLTRFHSRAPPGISVRDYLFRLIVHATLSPPILLSMVFYVDKLCTMYPAFTISSLTVHRFLITAATVAAKGLSDSFWTNSLYARVGGVSLRELALLELEFLRRLEWRIVPKPETLVDYYKGLVERGEGYVMEKDPVQARPSGPPATTQPQENDSAGSPTPDQSSNS